MYMYIPKPIAGLKIKYDGKEYDKIINLSINNYEDDPYNVRFEVQENEKMRTSIACNMEDIEFIK